ncbi:MAG: hypothetical protein J0L92_14900 [Deltaproteobacteria bacterium]|nr:hypothetical protein [Deltaproteobacteria bacterium]
MSSLVSSRSSLRAVSVAGLVSCVAFFTGLSACGSGAQCALDSDCALGLRCSAANQCVPRGAGDVDAAVVEENDAGPRRDGGPDAPVAIDAFSVDAPVPMDAPMDDANSDAAIDAFDDCPVIEASYDVGRTGLTCMSMATRVAFSRLDGLCAYELSSDRRGDIEGVMTYSSGTFSGGLNFPDVGRPCTLDLSVPPNVVIVCGSCTIELSPTPSP